jgi:hypothetical protein
VHDGAVTVDPAGIDTVGLSFDSAEGSPADLTGDPAFDQTGTRVVFVSAESGFGARDTNVRDLVEGTTRLVSANADNSDAATFASGQPVFLTGDQVRIAFTSFASNFGQRDLDQAGPLDAPWTKMVVLQDPADATFVAAQFVAENSNLTAD